MTAVSRRSSSTLVVPTLVFGNNADTRDKNDLGVLPDCLSAHGKCNNLFRLGRHLLKAERYRELRSVAFETWSQVTCA